MGRPPKEEEGKARQALIDAFWELLAEGRLHAAEHSLAFKPCTRESQYVLSLFREHR